VTREHIEERAAGNCPAGVPLRYPFVGIAEQADVTLA
jgi:hypothetical protein